MFKNYLTVAFRNLKRHKLYSTINILGLAVGMACCFSILLFVMDELSYDRFHTNADRIYRVVKEIQYKGDLTRTAKTYSSLAPALKSHFTEIEEIVRIHYDGAQVLRSGDHVLDEDQFYFADARFFDVFSFDLIQGDPQTALVEPKSLILSEALVQKLFSDTKVLGETVRVGDADYKVMGIAKNSPSNSHFAFQALGSMASLSDDIVAGVYSKSNTDQKFSYRVAVDTYTYVVLSENANITLQNRLTQFLDSYEPARSLINKGGAYKLSLQPLTDIRLQSDLADEIAPVYDMAYIYLFLTVAFIVLAIAGINFVNLSTARFSQRAQEVGVRKVVGASRFQLVQQFLGESILLSSIALFLGLALVEISLPWFSNLAEKSLAIEFSHIYLITVVLLTLVVGLVAGCYPALFLSKFRPAFALKGDVGINVRGRLRKGLVVFQFAVSVGLVIAFCIVFEQLHYIKRKSLGLNVEKLLVISVDHFPKNWKAIKAEWLRDPRIENISASWQAPALPEGRMQKLAFDVEDREQPVRFNCFVVDEDFLDVYGIHVIDGRAFSDAFSTDHKEAYMLNQAAVKALGWEQPINKKIDTEAFKYARNYGSGRVVGVVEDFHFQSLHHKVEPVVLLMVQVVAHYSVRFNTDDVSGMLADMEHTWRNFSPGQPMPYAFLDDAFAQYYRTEEKLMRMFAVFTGLAISIACLGLFGLAAFTAERRTKEIGVRKVMGASVSGIVMLLSKDFMKLVLIANVIAWPIAYWVMRDWLTHFAYRIDLEWHVFVLSGGLALLIALLTVGYQAWQAARANPVDALRYE